MIGIARPSKAINGVEANVQRRRIERVCRNDCLAKPFDRQSCNRFEGKSSAKPSAVSQVRRRCKSELEGRPAVSKKPQDFLRCLGPVPSVHS